MGNTFTAKQLRVTFALSGSSQFSNGSNTVVITGLRTSAIIQSMQYPAFPEADIDIWGMLQADMNTLTCFENQWSTTGNSVLNVTRNTVIIEASAGTGWTTVFAGQLVSAQPTYASAPEVALHIKARVLYYESIATTAVTSYTGTTSVATILSGLAARIGAQFENNGVTTTLANPYYPGTIGDQIQAVAEHANIALFYDYGPAGPAAATKQPPVVIAIAPKGQPRQGPVLSLTPQNGLVDYPTLDSLGWVYARAFYSPSLKFGGQVAISGCDLPRANATWNILQLTHTLEAVKPDGAWFSDMHLTGINPFPTA